MKRRSFLLGAAGLGAVGAGAWLLRPEDGGAGGHDAYFQGLTAALRAQNLARPTMLVDLDRLDFNIAELRKYIRPPKAYRVVAKSLPSKPLLDYVMARAETDRLMVFHQPFLNEVAAKNPDTEVLLGKPMPVAAAGRFYEYHRRGGFDPARQLQWLIDSPERLRQYQALAAGRELELIINIEIDVGLHRGGLQHPEQLTEMLKQIDAEPRLRFGGLMGYDPQVAKGPTVFGLQRREFEQVQTRYRGFLDAWRAHGGKTEEDELVLNAAGSPTFRRWEPVEDLANDLAAGSGLVKPLDFDIPSLDSHKPALFIATPVLKASAGIEMPIVPLLGEAQELWDPNRARTFFVYGGYWKAEPVSPPGLVLNDLYGRSSNQEMLNGSDKVKLAVDDYVFYRPTQSEFVMLQFGDIAVLRDGQIVDYWSVLAQAG